MASTSIMRRIRANDPDGGARQPTEADYRRFEEWVVRTYGATAWKQYRGVWDEEEAV